MMICLRRWLDAPPMNPEDKYWMPDTTPKDKSSKKKHRPTHCFEAVESAEDDLRRGALPQGGKEGTEDVLRFVEGDEATNAFVAQQKRDKKKKKRGKSKDALPLAEIGDLVALVVTVHKDGQIKYSGVKMESKTATDGATVTELPTEEEEATEPGREERTTTTRDEEILNSLHELAQTTDKEALEKIMMRNIEMAALEAHEQRKRDEDARNWAERKRMDEERAKEAEERVKEEAEERAKKEAEERAKKESEQRKRLKSEQRRRLKSEQRKRLKSEQRKRLKSEQKRRLKRRQRRKLH